MSGRGTAPAAAPGRLAGPARAVALGLLGALALACGPKYVRESVYEHRNLEVFLRAEVRDGERVDRGFSHPATISSVRLAHILSAIDVRFDSEDGGERKPAFETALLYTVGEQMALALAQADSSQEVVVKAVRAERNLAIFTSRYLTSFTAEVQGDDLLLHLSRIDWLVPKDQEDDIPEPWPQKQVQAFKVIPGDAIIPVGTQTVAVDWRNATFRDPSHVKVGPGGQLLRRQILLESPAEAPTEEEEEIPVVPAELSADTLRALADLQDRRSRGEISETRYHQERRDLLRKAAEEMGDESP